MPRKLASRWLDKLRSALEQPSARISRSQPRPVALGLETLEDRCLPSTLTVDGSQHFQTIDGLGTNFNSSAWGNGDVRPAIDMLMNQMGANLFRVVVEPVQGWEDTNPNTGQYSNANPNLPFYNNLYGTSAKFTNLWNTIGYLNAHNATVMLNVMGYGPSWMVNSDHTISQSHEADWVTMISTMVEYAVNTAHVHIDILSPDNEEDQGSGSPEGIQAGSTQYVRMLNELNAKLQSLGLGSIRLFGPDTASEGNADSSYIPAMAADSTLMQQVDHFGIHAYGSGGSGTASVVQSDAPTKDFWVTEYGAGGSDGGGPGQDTWGDAEANFQNQLNVLDNGASAATVYDGVDAFYQHHNAWSTWGMVAYNQSTQVYTPRQRLYANGMIDKFVTPGSIRVGVSDNASGPIEDAFYNPATGHVTIVGENTSGSALTITGTLSGGLAASSFEYYLDNASVQMQRQADVAVSNGTFTFTIPAHTIFTLSTPTSTSTAPAVFGVTPTTGSTNGGTVVTLTGTNFTGATQVLFGGTAATGFTVNSANQITATAPAHAAGTVDITVTTSNGTSSTSSSDQFTYNVPSNNLALSGTAYRWFAMTSSTAITNQTTASGLNDGNLTNDVPLTGAGDDVANAYEAGGVVWSTAQSVNKVTFTNGSFNSSSYDGVFDKNFGLQVTTDGTTWSAVSGWTLSPAYQYNLPAAAGVTYTFTGPTLSVRGVRVVGQVHSLSGNDSWFDNASEVQAFAGTSSPAPTVTGVAPGNGPLGGGTTVIITGTNLTSATAVSFGGTSASSFTVNSATQITATAPTHAAGTVDVTVTTANGTSATSSSDRFSYVAAPTITTQPASLTVTAGQSASFSVIASGTGLSYQWQKQVNGTWTNIAGATSATFTIGSTASSDAGSYWVVVANAGGQVISNTVTLAVDRATGGSNIAPNGTAYRWFGMSSATGNANKTAAPGLNDNNLTNDVPLTGAGDDVANAYEAGGVVWSSAQSLSKVTFTNGSFNSSSYDGVFDKNFSLQATTDGTTWAAVTGWSLSPAYQYNLPAAAGVTYTFTGPTLSVRGVRVVGQVHSLSGNDSWFDNASEVQAFTPTATSSPTTASPVSLFSSAATPAQPGVNDSNSVEVGVQFQSSVAGTITAIRFYRASPTAAGSKVDLGSATGTLLGTGTIPTGSGSTSGWVLVPLSQPVAIQAGVTYVASYYTSNGGYAATSNYFTSPFTQGPLTALASVYQYGTGGGFPTSTWQNSNYWVDIVFTPN